MMSLNLNQSLEPVSSNPIEATEPWSEASKRYRFISTQRIIEMAERAGFEVQSTKVSGTRDPRRIGYQKHLVNMVHRDHKTLEALGDSVPRLVLVNGHCSNVSFQLYCGLFRLVCTNGLILGDTFGLEKMRLHHTGSVDLEKQIAARLEQYFQQLPKIIEFKKRLESRQLETLEQVMLARAVADYIEKASDKKAVFSLDLLNVRRSADVGNDAWKVLNRIQENVIRGGYQFHSSTTGQIRRASAIKAIDVDIKLNQFIMDTVAGLVQNVA